MVSVIIPCTDLLVAKETARSVNTDNILEILIVVDGSDRHEITRLDGVVVIHLLGLNGSYTARNIGAQSAKGKYLFFLDSGVTCISLDFNNLSSEIIYGAGSVAFSRIPNNLWEQWYKKFAFNNIRFRLIWRFTPTISLLIDRHTFEVNNGFNANLLSGGDLDFCHRLKLPIDLDRISIETDLRNKGEIKLKLNRQLLGQEIMARASNRLSYCKITFLKFCSILSHLIIRVKYFEINVYRMSLFIKYMVRPKIELNKDLIRINKKEVLNAAKKI
tara:strand:+ start:703 stop:1524 length:822 start_codon:yes stop_codon:yes gene_type:complete